MTKEGHFITKEHHYDTRTSLCDTKYHPMTQERHSIYDLFNSCPHVMSVVMFIMIFVLFCEFYH